MKFQQIDPILSAWAQRHDLIVAREYKDYEVRAVRICGYDKEYAGISVDILSNGQVVVAVGVRRRWSRDSRSEKRETDLNLLDATLEWAYERAVQWLEP